MGNRLKVNDNVKIISGANKGKTGKITKIDHKAGLVFVEGLGNRERHVRASMYRQAGKKNIQTGIHESNVKLIVDEKSDKTSRVGYVKDSNGKTIRVAKQANNREIK